MKFPFEQILDVADKFKRVMLNKHLTFAVTHCPFCKGEKTLFGKIQGKRNHFHMQCKTCHITMME